MRDGLFAETRAGYNYPKVSEDLGKRALILAGASLMLVDGMRRIFGKHPFLGAIEAIAGISLIASAVNDEHKTLPPN